MTDRITYSSQTTGWFGDGDGGRDAQVAREMKGDIERRCRLLLVSSVRKPTRPTVDLHAQGRATKQKTPAFLRGFPYSGDTSETFAIPRENRWRLTVRPYWVSAGELTNGARQKYDERRELFTKERVGSDALLPRSRSIVTTLILHTQQAKTGKPASAIVIIARSAFLYKGQLRQQRQRAHF